MNSLRSPDLQFFLTSAEAVIRNGSSANGQVQAAAGRIFAALPDDDREILILREMESLSYEEIARRLDCSLDAVKGRLKRVRQSLVEKCSRFLQ